MPHVITYFFFSLSLFAFALTLFFTLKNGIGPCFTSKKVKQGIFELLPDDSIKTIVDLGSGWGSMLFLLAKRYPDAKIVGIENSPFVYLFSKLRIFLSQKKNLSILRTNIYTYPLKADLFTIYLYPKAMQRLERKFQMELTKNAFIITHTFSFPSEKPIKKQRAKDLYQTPIYLYLFNKQV